MGNIIDGKNVARNLYDQLKEKIDRLKESGKSITLAVVKVGDDAASEIYVSNKKKICEKIGINSRIFTFPPDIKEDKVLDLIQILNEDPEINGILVQLPLPKQLNERKIIENIAPNKDVDAFSYINVGRFVVDSSIKEALLPCTPAGIMRLLDFEDIDLSGKHCVIINRSNIVGKPLAMLMVQRDATVTICHSKTRNLNDICKTADISVSAVGRRNFITKDMVKEGAILIDVGINRDSNGKVCGDVDFQSVKDVASFITPVPGGVGPMTIAMLMENTLKAAGAQSKSDEI